MEERQATEAEVMETISTGETFPAKQNRVGFRSHFPYNNMRNGVYYANKQLNVICVRDTDRWIVVSVVVKFF